MEAAKGFYFILAGVLLLAIIFGVLAIGRVPNYMNVDLTEEQIVERDGNTYLLVMDMELYIKESLFEKIDLEEYKTYKLRYDYYPFSEDKGKVLNVDIYDQ